MTISIKGLSRILISEQPSAHEVLPFLKPELFQCKLCPRAVRICVVRIGYSQWPALGAKCGFFVQGSGVGGSNIVVWGLEVDASFEVG